MFFSLKIALDIGISLQRQMCEATIIFLFLNSFLGLFFFGLFVRRVRTCYLSRVLWQRISHT